MKCAATRFPQQGECPSRSCQPVRPGKLVARSGEAPTAGPADVQVAHRTQHCDKPGPAAACPVQRRRSAESGQLPICVQEGHGHRRNDTQDMAAKQPGRSGTPGAAPRKGRGLARFRTTAAERHWLRFGFPTCGNSHSAALPRQHAISRRCQETRTGCDSSSEPAVRLRDSQPRTSG